MRKLGLGIIGLLIVGAIYYFTAGSEQITAQMKKQVNAELTAAPTLGFAVEERKSDAKSEHFVLSFDDTEKITTFLRSKGIQVNAKDTQNLKGLKLGVDMHYLADAYSSVSLDLYPLALPTAFHASMQESNDKQILTTITTLLKKKALLVHVDVNKLANGFKGYVKDINETFQGEEKVHLSFKGMTFQGDIKEKRAHNVTQAIEEIKVTLSNELEMTLKKMQGHYVKTGKTDYDYQTNYTIKQMSLESNKAFSLYTDDLDLVSESRVKDTLASGEMRSKARTITIVQKGQKTIFDTFVVNTDASNLDMTALTKLQTANPNNPEETSHILQQLISKGVQLNLSEVSVKNIHHIQQDLGGFTLLAHLDIDKSLNVQATNQNPLAALNTVDANVKISFDKPLFSLIAQQPRAMMMLMLFQPKDVNGKKVYQLELKDGKFTANGVSVN